MIPASKNPQANALRGKADELRKKLGDDTVQLTSEQVAQHVSEINAYETRAATVAGFTPEAEIESQGGDDELRQAAPDAEDKETQKTVTRYAQWSKDTLKVFGSVDNYIRTIVNPQVRGTMTKKQMDCVQRGKRLAVRSLGHEDLETRATIIGDANDGSGGEFLLPLQQETSIFQISNSEQPGILQRAVRYPVTGRVLRIPYVVQTDGGVTRPMAGIAAITIVGEGQPKPERTPVFLQRILNVYKWAAISKLGDEILADDMTGDLAPTVTRLVGGQVMNEMNDYMTVIGTGTAQPLGALNAANPSLLVVNRTTSQTVTPADIFDMWAKHTMGPGSFWLVSRALLPKLFGMTLGSNTLVSFIRDFQGNPQMALLGYPIVVSDLSPQLGVQGDLALINPAFYAVAIRTQLTVESSIHVEFVNDVTTYRFFARGGGIPIPDGTYAYKTDGSGNKINEHSPFVVLGDDVTS